MKIPVRSSGYDLLREELLKLKSQRVDLANAIEVAKELGDLKENADYHAAKEHSGMVEAKIRDLESRLSNCEVIEIEKGEQDKVVFSCSVELQDLDSDEIKTYTIVGSEESDVKNGLISYDSPIARSLIGKEAGEVVIVNVPGGKKEYEIMKIWV